MNDNIDDDIVSKIRQIICNNTISNFDDEDDSSTIYLGDEFTDVFLQLTSRMYNINHLKLDLLASSIYDFAQGIEIICRERITKCLMEVMYPFFPDYSGIRLFQFFHDNEETREYEIFNTLKLVDYEKKGYVLYFTKKVEEDNVTLPDNIVVTDAVPNKINFEKVTNLRDIFYFYTPVKTQEQKQLFAIQVLQGIIDTVSKNTPLSIININDIVSTEQFDCSSPIDNNVNIWSISFLECILNYIVPRINEKYPGFINYSMYDNFGTINLVTQTISSVILFKRKHLESTEKSDNHDQHDYYLPLEIYNQGTKKLNFLVWCADVDSCEFVRHSPIQRNDRLSARLPFNVVMLVYCEKQSWQDSLTELLYNTIKGLEKNNTISNQEETNESEVTTDEEHLDSRSLYLVNEIKKIIAEIQNSQKGAETNKIIGQVIPMINEFYNRTEILSRGEPKLFNLFSEPQLLVQFLMNIYNS